MGKINVCDKIIIENQKKYGNQVNFVHKSPSNRWFRSGIHSLLSQADARGSAAGATENARPDIARPSKLWGLTSRDWTTRHYIARVDIARLVSVFE